MSGMIVQCKVATEAWEFEQIHRLNYQTFVEEIPQHPPNPEKKLVDKFHQENTYLICLNGQQVVGMVAVRDRRPFSLDAKLDSLTNYLPPHRSICEIRLLAVDPGHRSPRVFQRLMLGLAQYVGAQGYDLAVMSGTVRQQKLYGQLGFTAFGPLVGSAEALYQPMYMTLADFAALKQRTRTFASSRSQAKQPMVAGNFLPGPVPVSESVRKAHDADPVSHRSASFMADFAETKRWLCQLAGSRFVEILPGSGTLANDVIAAQLSLLDKPGLILSNGEFGERLIDHATRFKLAFHVVRAEWGRPFNYKAIGRLLADYGNLAWIWAVHCETSSGLLTDIEQLARPAAARDMRLCLDCISSIGNVPVDLSAVYLASGTSGKGLGAYPGLALVFYNHDVQPKPQDLPRYLDLGLYAAQAGVPFTISSNLLYALLAAVRRITPSAMGGKHAMASALQTRLAAMGLQLIGQEGPLSPAVVTIALPEAVSSAEVGDRLEQLGYLVSYRSGYLLARNWMQICLMGECNHHLLDPLLTALQSCYQSSAGQSRATVKDIPGE